MVVTNTKLPSLAGDLKLNFATGQTRFADSANEIVLVVPAHPSMRKG